jgi:hypothetical protein
VSDMNDRLIRERELSEAERRALKTARRFGKNVTFIDDDGCEVTVTPGAHVFYNATDWW